MRVLAAVAAGLLQALAFPPIGWWWTAPLGVALFVVATTGTTGGRAAALGYLSGLSFFVPLVQWLSVLGPDAWLLLALALSGWFAGMGWAANVLRTSSAWVVLIPALWVLQEALRGRFPWGGLGWGRLAFSQADSPLTDWVSLGGAALLSYVVALLGCLLLQILTSTTREQWVIPLLAGVAVVTIGSLAGFPAVSTQTPQTARLAVVQGSVPQAGIDFNSRRLAVLENHAMTTIALAQAVDEGAEPRPDAVIWPENSSDLDPTTAAEAQALVTAAVDAIDTPLLVGTVQEVPGSPSRVANVGLVWEPGVGPTQYYIKQHPVPFGEFLPFRSVLQPLITRFDRVPRDFIAGDEPGVLDLGPARVADVICFEVSDDGVVRDGVRGGGRALVVQTNNATYAETAQPEQQFAIARLRARETGRVVLVAATTGVTAVITPDGEALELPQMEPGWLNPEVVLTDSWTPAVRFGAVLELALCLLTVVGLVDAMVRRRRGRR